MNASNQYGDTPLEHAARCGHVKCLRLLVEAGADVNIRNEDDETALFEAAYNGYDKCVDALIQAGADVNVTSKVTPLYLEHLILVILNVFIFLCRQEPM